MAENESEIAVQAEQRLEDRAAKYLEMFEFTRQDMVDARDQFNEDCRRSLRHHRDPASATAKMPFYDTCVTRVPNGTERGTYYAIDFGGTNLRAVRVVLDGNGGHESQSISRNISEIPTNPPLPKGLMDERATATMLFDAIALLARELMEETVSHLRCVAERLLQGDLERAKEDIATYPVGFTFSFPMIQTAISSGLCSSWTKGFETGRATDDKVEREADVCQLLDAAFARNEVPGEVVAALNDTTGTLVAMAYEANRQRRTPPCGIGFIMGTGMNACYLEKSARAYGFQGLIINTELGKYARAVNRNIIDIQVDCADNAPGEQLNEKMCSGLFLPEVCRRTILRVFAWQAPPLAWVRRSLSCEACCLAGYDESEELEAVQALCQVQLEWPLTDGPSLRLVRDLCRQVLRRSATLLAVYVAALAKQTGRLQYAAGGITVGIDGSVYKRNSGYQRDVRRALNTLLGEGLARLINMKVSTDGSGIGAAILAACEARGPLSALSGKDSFLGS